MKKKVLVTSLLTIALCISVICGATLAIFTSESKTNIAVQTGKVEVVATVNEDSIKTYSNGKEMQENKFENGGSVSYADGEFTIDRITPGDKVTFDINIENNSDIKILYKVGYTVDNADLEEAMVISFEGMTAGEWVAKNPGEEIGSVSASIELPFEASGVQGKTANIAVNVEAVQANANIADSEKSLKDKIANAEAGDTIVLMDDITLTEELNVLAGKDVIIDGNGNTINSVDTNAVILVQGKAVFKNINFTANEQYTNFIKANGDVTVDGCTLTDGDVAHLVYSNSPATSIVIRNCTSSRPVINVVEKSVDCPVLIENNTFTNSGQLADVLPITFSGKVANITIKNNTNTVDSLLVRAKDNVVEYKNVYFEGNTCTGFLKNNGLIKTENDKAKELLNAAIKAGEINLKLDGDKYYQA